MFNNLEEDKNKLERKRKMIEKPDYINWLINFTKNINGFCNDNYLYCLNDISKENNNMVNDLGLFFEVIDKYARKNNIFPIPCEFGIYYNIYYNDIGFEIGVLRGQGVVSFCNKLNIIDKEKFINYNDILNNLEKNKIKHNNNKLEELSNIVINMYKSGIPLSLIINTFDNTIDDIKNSNNLKMKLKKR